jgi:hypothetical protein
LIVDNYPFVDFFQRMIHTLIQDPQNILFNSASVFGTSQKGVEFLLGGWCYKFVSASLLPELLLPVSQHQHRIQGLQTGYRRKFRINNQLDPP